MKRKIQIDRCIDPDDSLECRTAGMLNKMNCFNSNSDMQMIFTQENDKSKCENQQNANEDKQKTPQINAFKSSAKKLRSLKTICKSINKFKSVNKKSKNFKKIVNRSKVNQLVQLFVQKLTRSIKSDQSHIQSELIVNQKQNFLDNNGLDLPQKLAMFINFLNVLNFLILFVILTFGMVFDSFLQNSVIKYLQILSIINGFMNLFVNLVTVQTLNGKRIQKIKQIGINYLEGQFTIDLICIVVLIIDLSTDIQEIKYLRLVFLIQFWEFKKSIQQLQCYFINNFYREQYWGICHLMLSNFLVAHIIAIILLSLVALEPENNWLKKSGLAGLPWHEEYAWAYYWAVTTMLSVGYGDIVAVNSKQAICVAFVQIFSCIILAYTINSVGNLIQKLRQKDLQKNKNLKIFKQIVQNNCISRRVEENVGNFINEAIQIKTKFNYDQQKKLLQQLPKQAKSDILKQCNSKLFKNIVIFQNMGERVITELANKIELTIAHPQQIIFSSNSAMKLLILKEGKVGYYACQQKFRSKYLMNLLKVNVDSISSPLHLNFITKQKPNFTIKSQNYSIIYEMNQEILLTVLKNYPFQNQKYCILRDKSKHILNQFQIINCQTCKTKHTKADCPKIHFIPLKQTIVFKHLQKNKQIKCGRARMERKQKKHNCYRLFIFVKRMKSQIQYLNGQNMNTLAEIIVLGMQYVNSAGRNDMIDSKVRQVQPVETKNFQTDSSIPSTKRKFNSILQVTNKILANLKMDEDRLKKPFTLLSELYAMMGVECDVLHDYLNYFPEANPKIIAKQIRKLQQTRESNKKDLLISHYERGQFFDIQLYFIQIHIFQYKPHLSFIFSLRLSHSSVQSEQRQQLQIRRQSHKAQSWQQ